MTQKTKKKKGRRRQNQQQSQQQEQDEENEGGPVLYRMREDLHGGPAIGCHLRPMCLDARTGGSHPTVTYSKPSLSRRPSWPPSVPPCPPAHLSEGIFILSMLKHQVRGN